MSKKLVKPKKGDLYSFPSGYAVKIVSVRKSEGESKVTMYYTNNKSYGKSHFIIPLKNWGKGSWSNPIKRQV